MSAELEPRDLDLFHGKSLAHFATLNADGSPHVVPVWIDEKNGTILVNTAAGRVKDRNARRDPRVAFSIHDQKDPDRWIAIRGTVIEFIEGEEADEHIEELSRRYYEEEWDHVEGQTRVIYKIRPDRVSRGDV